MPPPASRSRSIRRHFASLQVGQPVLVQCPGGPGLFRGTLVEKTVHLNERPAPRNYHLLWVKHAGGTGCFWPTQVLAKRTRIKS